MPEYPETRLDKAIDRSLAQHFRHFVESKCNKCLGTTRIYIDGRQRKCDACQNGER